MRLLLDTCVFLWLISRRGELPQSVCDLIADPDNACFLSAASLWEILAKHGAGRLDIDGRGTPVEVFLTGQREAHGIDPLPVDEAAVAQLPKLPNLHRDPFDRMLVCQAIAHGLTVVTPDEAIRQYPVLTLW